ncbi:MAG: HAD hydrolase-like protein, partial [Bacilli bacterium]
MTNKYKLLIFDVDGTLADTDKMLIETYRTLYELYSPNVKLDESKVIGFSGPPLRETLSTEFPLYDPEFMIKEYKKYSRPNYVKYVTTFFKTRELLLKLKEEGYYEHDIYVKRLTDPSKYTTVRVLTKEPNLELVKKNSDKIRPVES